MEIKVGTHLGKKWADTNSKTMAIADIKSMDSKNNLANILYEKNIDANLSEIDLLKVNCTKEKWLDLIEGKEGFCFMGSNENLFRIATFLEVNLCDLFGLCMKHGGESVCGNCTSAIKHSWKRIGVIEEF